MAGVFERSDGGVLRLVRLGLQAEVSEDAIVAVDRRLAERFAIDRDDAFADFAGGFGEELFEPCAEIVNSRRRDDRDLVAAVNGSDADNRAKNDAGIFVSRDVGAAGLHHLVRDVEKFRDVDAHDGAGHHAEIRKRGIAAADAGHTEENFAKFVAFRDFLHLRARDR